jgi:hypothetical protein
MPKELNTTQLLFVRACKADCNTNKRLERIYRNRYCSPKNHMPHLCGVLLDIVTEYCPMSVREVVEKLNPDNYMGLVDLGPYHTRVFNMCVTRLALTECSKLPGYIAPACLRTFRTNKDIVYNDILTSLRRGTR